MPEPSAGAPPPTFVPLASRRVGATPAALDGLVRPHLRIAADEALVFGADPVDLAEDPHAIDLLDGGWLHADLAEDLMLDHLAAMTDWRVDSRRPQVLQGLAAGVPIKVLLADDATTTVVVARAYVHELRERWR